jgi:S-DNA-T family DNA segregation ATPase FtsK/SpoIIIE
VAAKKTGKPASPAPPEKPAQPADPFQGRYTVKPEFWDRILDTIPPWGDEIAAIMLIVFGIVSFLSLFDVSSDATISRAWSTALTSLFGYGSLVVAGGILALGVLILLPKAGVKIHLPAYRILALEVGFLALLALLHLVSGDTEWRAVARAGVGGGIVGWGLSILIGGLFSSAFAFFVYGMLFLFCLLVVIGVRHRHVLRLLTAASQRLHTLGQRLTSTPEPPRRAAPAKPAAAPAAPANPDLRRLNIIHIRPNPANLPPSMRPGARAETPPPASAPAASIPDALREITERPPVEHIIPEFNAIGTLQKKERKDDPQLVMRPDGRVKRYFSVESMAEPKQNSRREPPLPPLDLLRDVNTNPPDEIEINTNVVLIENTLLEFDIDVDVVDVQIGPTVTRYAVQPFKEQVSEEGEESVFNRTRVRKIASLSSDLALSLAARRLRLETPVPGQNYIGIEVPNRNPQLVTLRAIFESRYFYNLMQKKKSPLLIPLGRDVAGVPVAADIGQMPHLLIAGTTGSGKSVAIAALATALIMNNTPDALKLIMLDPKMVELSRFNGVPHLIGPVETDQERIIGVLRWCTREMDRRYKLLEEHASRNIDTYNARLGRRQQSERLPYIVILVDEIGDLMLSQPEETEKTVTRLAQMARAVGMHLIVATQRPSVDVITGLIKANFPTRMSFAVATGVDSRVILDTGGAENLLGNGDMLFLANDAAGPRRIQGCFVSDDEVRAVVNHWKTWHKQQIAAGSMAAPAMIGPWERGVTRREILSETDPMLEEAIELVIQEGEASASLIQRKMGLGYPRAARLIDLMYELRVIGPPEAGGRSRRVLIKPGEDPFKTEIDKRTSGG